MIHDTLKGADARFHLKFNSSLITQLHGDASDT